MDLTLCGSQRCLTDLVLAEVCSIPSGPLVLLCALVEAGSILNDGLRPYTEVNNSIFGDT